MGESMATVTALEAVRVLDLADESAVFATRILADLGADVIRVEHPDGGSVRNMEPFLDGKPGAERSLYHLYHNANKRSVTLDVTMADGADVLRRLAVTADVIVETAAPGAMAALGLAYEDLTTVNASIIYISVTPFGQQGPWSGRRANDLVATAASGLLHVTGDPDGPPVQGAADPAYKEASLAAAAGVMIALTGREATADRTGAHLDISIQECTRMTILEVSNPNIYTWNGRVPGRPGHGGAVRCADGGWVGINVRPDRFGGFLDWVRDAGIETDLTEANWDAATYEAAEDRYALVHGLVEELAAVHTRDAFVERALDSSQMCLPILELSEMSEIEHFRVNRQFLEVEHEALGRTLGFPRSPVDATAGEVRIRAAPTLGEHNTQIYAELGLGAEELDLLHQKGVL